LLIYLKSLGARNKIQVSQSTADLLVAAGKGHWIKPRKDAVTAKGKGVLKTFWLNPDARKGSSAGSSETGSTADLPQLAAAAIVKQDRLVDWMVELFLEHIKKIVSGTLPTGSLSSSIRRWHEVSHMLLL
jgi:hypothetical protein